MNFNFRYQVGPFFLICVLILISYDVKGSDKEKIKLRGEVNTPFVHSDGGTVYLHITIETPKSSRKQRKPLNLSVVADRSGSMSGERKMHYVKTALTNIVEQMQTSDIFSLVIYDDEIEILHEAQQLINSHGLHHKIETIFPRGSTNLGGGMEEGFHQAARNKQEHITTRVILLSDGLANVGTTDPHTLFRRAQHFRQKGISLTTIGVGLDYNENLMKGLAEYGGGNYYFIESPSSIPHFLRKELQSTYDVIAQDIHLNIELGNNVKVLDVIGFPWEQTNENCSITLGDLISDQRLELTLELLIPKGTGTAVIAQGTVNSPQKNLESEFRTSIEYTQEETKVIRNLKKDIQAKVDVALSTRSVDDALVNLDDNNVDAAIGAIQAAKSRLKKSAGLESENKDSINNQIQELEKYEEEIRSKGGNEKGVKKKIQYLNYRSQKKK